VASTSGSDPRRSHPHQTMRLPERPAHSSPAVIIGSSMVRNISVPEAKTLCYPGARVQDITKQLLTFLRQMPGAGTVVVHVGSNDIRRASSEHLKIYFKELIFVLPSFHHWYTSGTSVHIWLKYYCYCISEGVTFIDNFDTFWKQEILLAPGLLSKQ
jgi:hypothetical protein